MTTPSPVALPAYERARLTPGIVHIGLGNFHRAHMAVYLDDLFAKGLCLDWAIIGAGVRPADARMRDALKWQDCLSTVIELDPVTGAGFKESILSWLLDNCVAVKVKGPFAFQITCDDAVLKRAEAQLAKRGARFRVSRT